MGDFDPGSGHPGSDRRRLSTSLELGSHQRSLSCHSGPLGVSMARPGARIMIDAASGPPASSPQRGKLHGPGATGSPGRRGLLCPLRPTSG